MRLINEYVVKLALKERLTFSSLAVGDTTARTSSVSTFVSVAVKSWTVNRSAGVWRRAATLLQHRVA